MTQDNAMSPENTFIPDGIDHSVTAAREEKRRQAVARAISRTHEGREMYWQDYLSEADAAIAAYRRES